MQPLPTETRSLLRSTQILTTLPQITSELVQNALDAGAHKVEIGVHFAEWTCWVRDDGSGISKDGLAALSERNRRYHTSKTYEPASPNSISTFGFRGEALASAADIGCLEINSRTSGSRQTWSCILKGGECLYQGPALRWTRDSSGTTVCVRDAFYNLPVRRRSHPNSTKTLDLIRKNVETLALIFHETAFSLEDSSDTSPFELVTPPRMLAIPKTSSILATFRHIHGRALIEHVDDVDVKSGECRIQGFISLNGALSRNYQYIYVNRYAISRCELHELIESKFVASSFAKNAYDEGGQTSLAHRMSRRSPRKAEKRPVYVLSIALPPREVDNCLEPEKTSLLLKHNSTVMAFLADVVDAFLRRHNFLHSHVRGHTRATHPKPSSPNKKRRIISNDHSEYYTQKETPDKPALVASPSNANSAEIAWTDPDTRDEYAIDLRTGNSYSTYSRQLVTGDKLPQGHTQGRLRPLPLSSRKFVSVDDKDTPEWIRNALGKNHAFALAEPSIPIFADSLPATQRVEYHEHNNPVNEFSRLRRADLAEARVLGQADAKFVVCVAGKRNENEQLVIIDQHAADERIRVERFFRQLCTEYLGPNGVTITKLDPPHNVLLTSEEARVLKHDIGGVTTALLKWGVRMEDTETDEVDQPDASTYTQVGIGSIPALVEDKLLVGEELRDFLKHALAQLDYIGSTPASGSGLPVLTQSQSERFTTWQKALRYCPRSLVELINSKACRGAIMFNDVLTALQCERLVRDLAETDLPFQCAHGRPSLVPLANLSTFSAKGPRVAKEIDWAAYTTRAGTESL